MYERFEPSDRVFVDREEYLDWMAEALERCKEKSVVLHLHGIGGIGKSSLLDHWKSTIDETIRLDCEQYTDFYARLNVIAKGAILLGVNLRRFDVLWQIRQRFVEGVEPVKEKGREWAKEVVMAIPFIGSLASIGSAISAIGAKVSPKIKGRYGVLGEWLQTRLGKDYIQRLLEILWKEPEHAEFLYLDALLEDLNNRKTSEKPILFLLDQFEDVGNERRRWRYGGREITEAELWSVFLRSLYNCVGVMASRQVLPSKRREEIDIEDSELTELDRESSIELLEQRQIENPGLQNRIVSVSGGNPFVIGAMCDLADSSGLSPNDVEDLRADTLEDVRLRTWRRLFSKSHDLLRLVEKAGLIPFFNRRIMTIVAPDMRTDHWDRLIHLSFVRERGDGTWVVHDLARELIMAELGQRLRYSTDDMARLLEESSTRESDYTLLGLAMSVRALLSETDAEARVGSIIFDLVWNYAFTDALAFLDAVAIDTKQGQAILQGMKGGVLQWLSRFADGEHSLLGALEFFEEFGEGVSDELLVHKARTLRDYGNLLYRTERISEAIETIQKSISIYRKLDDKTIGFRIEDMARAVAWFAWFLIVVNRLEDGEKAYREARELFEKSTPSESYNPISGITTVLRGIGTALFFAGKVSEAEGIFREGLEIYRELANDGAAVDIRHLAVGLYNFGEVLRLTNRPYEAEEVLRESISLVRNLVKIDSETYLSFLVFAINLLALPLRQTGRFSEAEEGYLEALAISRELAEEAPDAFSFSVSWTLLDLAVLLRLTGRMSEAEENCREALRIHRRLAARSPGKHDSILSWNLNNLAVLLRRTGRESEAEEAYREALDIALEIASEAPEAVFLTDMLATILSNLAVLLRQTDRTSEAEETLLEALEIRRQLAQKSSELFLHRVATTLNNLGVLLAETDRLSEAEGALLEALELHRELSKESPDLYQQGVESTLNNLAMLFKRTGQSSEANDLYCEAIEIGEELFLKVPSVYRQGLVRALCNYALLVSDVDDTGALQKTVTRLKKLGVESLPESEEWSEEEEEETNAPGAV